MLSLQFQPNEILATFSYSMQYSCHSSFGVCAASSIICKDKMNMCLLLKFIFIWGLKKLSDDFKLFIQQDVLGFKAILLKKRYVPTIHYEKEFTKTIQCPKILNKYTKFQFEEYLTNSKIIFCLFLLKISKNLLNSLNIQ